MARWAKTEYPYNLPQKAGVYLIYLKENSETEYFLGYIGSSSNIRRRFYGHKIDARRYSSWMETPWGTFSDVFVKYRCPKTIGKYAMLEIQLLKKLSPKFNKVGYINA